MSTAAEGIRETASNLLRIANQLDGIDVSADAMRSGVATQGQAQEYLDGLLRERGTVRVDNGDGTSSYRNSADVEQEQAERKRSAFLIGADRDGAVSLQCVQLDGWQLAAEHQKEHDGATSNTEQECSTAYVPDGFGLEQWHPALVTLTCLRKPCRWERKVRSTDGIAGLFAEHQKEHDGA